MAQDLKCFFGVHRYELLDKIEVKDQRSIEVIGLTYVSRCSNCGKLRNVFVPTNVDYLNFNRR